MVKEFSTGTVLPEKIEIFKVEFFLIEFLFVIDHSSDSKCSM